MRSLRPLSLIFLLAGLALGPAACCTAPSPPSGAVITLPQDLAALAPRPGSTGCLVRPAWQKERAADYLRSYFDCWQRTMPRHTRQELFELADKVILEPGAGENLRPHAKGWARGLWEKAGGEAYPSADWPGLTLRACDLRVLPSKRPDFGDQPGGGYPFDRLQQTSLPAGLPVRVWHVSPRGDWLVAETPLALGWLPRAAVARLSPTQAQVWQGGPFLAVTRDQGDLRDEKGRFVMDAALGWLLPLRGRTPRAWRVLLPRAGAGERTELSAAYLPRAAGAPFPLALTPAHLTALAQPLLGRPYGWGGLGGHRDCSSLVRDLMAPFGLWLPRNSADQARTGQKVISLAGLDDAAKLALIREQGIPWLCLLYLPGHVMLYLGSPGGSPRVLHAMWGLKTRGPGGEGRRVVGRVVITDLYPGAHLPSLARPEGLVLPRISALVLLAPPGALCP